MSEHRFHQTTSRVQSSAGDFSVQSTARSGAATHIPAYKPSTGSNIGLFNTVNRVQSFQQLFKLTGHGDVPVFLRTPRDVIVYKGLMAFSLVGIGLTFFGLSSMALGKMQKK